MNSLDKKYQQLLSDIIEFGVEKSDRTGTGTISEFGHQIRHKMSEGFPLLTTKKMHWNSIVTELLWFLRGDTNIKFLLDYDCHIWDGDAYKGYQNQCVTHNVEPMEKDKFISAVKNGNNKEPHFIPDFTGYKLGDLGPIYGKQWRTWESVDTSQYWQEDWSSKDTDQIQNLINELKTNPDSRRLMVSAWNVGELDQMVLPPCHYGFQCYTTELSYKERYKIWFSNNYETGFEYNDEVVIDFENEYWEPTPARKLDLKWTQRSVDTQLGLPFNIASYGFLLHLLAKEVNMIPGDLIFSGGDVHLYSNHVEDAKEQIKRETFELPKLVLKNKSINDLKYEDFEIIGYKSSAVLKSKLSN